jgi:hypothetical protein
MNNADKARQNRRAMQRWRQNRLRAYVTGVNCISLSTSIMLARDR